MVYDNLSGEMVMTFNEPVTLAGVPGQILLDGVMGDQYEGDTPSSYSGNDVHMFMALTGASSGSPRLNMPAGMFTSNATGIATAVVVDYPVNVT